MLLKLAATILWLILFIWSLLDIIKAHKDTGWKLIWILACLIFPIAGVIIYYFFARQKDMQLPQDFQKGFIDIAVIATIAAVIILSGIIGGGIYLYVQNRNRLELNLPPVACTLEVKMCPDGSFVGRIGPNCEFALCPGPDQSPTPTPTKSTMPRY